MLTIAGIVAISVTAQAQDVFTSVYQFNDFSSPQYAETNLGGGTMVGSINQLTGGNIAAVEIPQVAQGLGSFFSDSPTQNGFTTVYVDQINIASQTSIVSSFGTQGIGDITNHAVGNVISITVAPRAK